MRTSYLYVTDVFSDFPALKTHDQLLFHIRGLIDRCTLREAQMSYESLLAKYGLSTMSNLRFFEKIPTFGSFFRSFLVFHDPQRSTDTCWTER